jgi:hypothetical protein
MRLLESNLECATVRDTVRVAASVGKSATSAARARHWSLLLLGAAIIFFVGHIAGAVQKEQDTLTTGTLSAERYELLGGDGKVVALLTTEADGQPSLAFLDKNAVPRLRVGLDRNGLPAVSLTSATKEVRMRLSLEGDNAMPKLSLYDKDGASAIQLEVTPDFDARVSIGAAKRSRIQLNASKRDGPSIDLRDPMGNPRLSFRLLDDQPIISLYDAKYVVRSMWSTKEDGSVSFSLFDANQKQRLVLFTRKDGSPSIRFIDPDNRVQRELKADVN